MSSTPDKYLVVNGDSPQTPMVKTALGLLLQAHTTAARLGRDKWDFALEIQALKEAGLNHNDLRSLICQGFIEHCVERTRCGAKQRTFRRPSGLRLARRSCFTLAETSIPIARHLIAHGAHLPEFTVHAEIGDIPHVEFRPYWDGERRELRLGNVLVKRFRQPAKNQETVLAAFQEDGWPAHVDNPLSGDVDIDARDRLHDTVRKLNCQSNRLLHFCSDGNGEGVVWSLASQMSQKRPKSDRRAAIDVPVVALNFNSRVSG
jgi:hypothetical protein